MVDTLGGGGGGRGPPRPGCQCHRDVLESQPRGSRRPAVHGVDCRGDLGVGTLGRLDGSGGLLCGLDGRRHRPPGWGDGCLFHHRLSDPGRDTTPTPPRGGPSGARAYSCHVGHPGLVVLILAWIPPLVQEFAGHPGNLSALYDFFTKPSVTAAKFGSTDRKSTRLNSSHANIS